MRRTGAERSGEDQPRSDFTGTDSGPAPAAELPPTRRGSPRAGTVAVEGPGTPGVEDAALRASTREFEREILKHTPGNGPSGQKSCFRLGRKLRGRGAGPGRRGLRGAVTCALRPAPREFPVSGYSRAGKLTLRVGGRASRVWRGAVRTPSFK